MANTDKKLSEMDLIRRIVNHQGRWLHKNGKIYTVIHISNLFAEPDKREEYPIQVSYRGEDGKIWSKSPEAFLLSRTECE